MNTVNDFKAGDRVALHPACDLWMRGARFGDVVSVSRKGFVTVKLDNVKRPVKLHPSNLLFV